MKEMKRTFTENSRFEDPYADITVYADSYCKDSAFEKWPLAMAYVPSQGFHHLYEPADALNAGTVFSDLNLPFIGGGANE